MAMDAQDIFNKLKEKFKDNILEFKDGITPFIKINPKTIIEIASFLSKEDTFKFNYLMSIAGIDNPENLTVVYHLCSIEYKHRIALKAELSKENPKIHSVMDIWLGANWHERETYDLFGIIFEGHKDFRRILLPEDWDGHPLRKDYKFPTEYKGIKI